MRKLILAILVSIMFAGSYANAQYNGGPFGDGSGGGGTGFTASSITGQTEDTAPTSDDFIPSYDNSSGGLKKVTLGNAVNKREYQYFDKVFNFDGSSTYTDNTTESKTTFGTAFNFMYNSSQILYLGKSEVFDDIMFTIARWNTGSQTVTATYWNGSTWASLTISDGTSSMTQNGAVTFTPPSDWAKTDVNSQNYYWIALNFSTNPSTSPSCYAVRPSSNQTMSVYSSYSDSIPSMQITADGKVKTNGSAITPIATYTVGLRTSTGGHNADFVCTGEKDQVCINKAITACGSSPCKIIILDGTYSLNGSITPLKSNLEISGQGAGVTVLKTTDITGATFQDTTSFTSVSHGENIYIHDMEIDRSSDTKDENVTRKAIFTRYVDNLVIERVYAHDSGGTCFGVDFLDGARISDNYLVNCGTSSATTGSSGIGIGTGKVSSEPIVIANNVIKGSGLAGVLLEAQSGAIESKNFSVTDNILLDGNQYGIYVRGLSGVNITGNIIRNNTKDGIKIDDYQTITCDDILIGNNNITDNTLYGVSIVDAGATNIKIIGNMLHGNGSGSITSNMTSVRDLERFGNSGDTDNYLSSMFTVKIPVLENINAGGTITANGCGGLKPIGASGAVTTDTTNTFTAPASSNYGCCMKVVNVSADTITLDNNAKFYSSGAADVVLGQADTVEVCSDSNLDAWVQVGATGNN